MARRSAASLCEIATCVLMVFSRNEAPTSPVLSPRRLKRRRLSNWIVTQGTFSEHGLAGARVDRIAELAGANKRMIYAYFGDKDRLYDALIERQIAEWAEAVPFTPDDLAAYAIGRFEYMRAHPDV